MVIYHIDMVILDIDMGYGLMIWEMKVSIRSSSVSMWDILSLCPGCLPERQDMIWSYCPVDRQDDKMTGFWGSS